MLVVPSLCVYETIVSVCLCFDIKQHHYTFMRPLQHAPRYWTVITSSFFTDGVVRATFCVAISLRSSSILHFFLWWCFLPAESESDPFFLFTLLLFFRFLCLCLCFFSFDFFLDEDNASAFTRLWLLQLWEACVISITGPVNLCSFSNPFSPLCLTTLECW